VPGRVDGKTCAVDRTALYVPASARRERLEEMPLGDPSVGGARALAHELRSPCGDPLCGLGRRTGHLVRHHFTGRSGQGLSGDVRSRGREVGDDTEPNRRLSDGQQGLTPAHADAPRWMSRASGGPLPGSRHEPTLTTRHGNASAGAKRGPLLGQLLGEGPAHVGAPIQRGAKREPFVSFQDGELAPEPKDGPQSLARKEPRGYNDRRLVPAMQHDKV
jgi:hypothetical protein